MRPLVASLLLLVLALALGAGVSLAGEARPAANQYRLFSRDLVRIGVQGEPDVSAERRVDGAGEINVPLIGALKVSGLGLTEVQALITKRYIEGEVFVRPEVVVTVIEYSPKEIMVLGQVSRQGKQPFPPEAAAMNIVEAVTSAGGFTRIAKSDAVRVTRKEEGGGEQSFTVNVEKMIDGRGGNGEAFMLQPGDVVFVPERVF